MTAQREREEFTAEDFERHERRKNWNSKRPNGSIPRLTDEILDDPEWLRDWLTVSLRPRQGWRVADFKHGEDDDHCTIFVSNGTERATYRFRKANDLNTSVTRMLNSISTVTGNQLRPPHFKGAEFTDIWRALCGLGPALDSQGELEQARDWLFRLLDVAHPMEGHSLADSTRRRDALLALKRWGEFTYLDALAIRKSPELPWPRRPVCLIDSETGGMWLRAREAATFLRHILDMRIRQGALDRRWEEIGVARHYYQSNPRRAGDPHPQAHLYLVPRPGRSG